MKYIDFDGVILDSEVNLFRDWYKKPNYRELGEKAKIKYIQNVSWRLIINESMIINDSIYILKHCDYQNTSILTRVHSLHNEALEKIKFLREQGIKQSIIIVPYGLKKSEVVEAEGNILIDDDIMNLNDWEHANGRGILFNKDGLDVDSKGRRNNKPYQKILSLKDIDRL